MASNLITCQLDDEMRHAAAELAVRIMGKYILLKQPTCLKRVVYLNIRSSDDKVRFLHEPYCLSVLV